MTKPLRERLIDQGILTPGTETLRTWIDPYNGFPRWDRPTMGAQAVARTKAHLIRKGLFVPRAMRGHNGKLH